MASRVQVLNGANICCELVFNKVLTTLGKIGVQVVVTTMRPPGYFVTHVKGRVFSIANGNLIDSKVFELSDHNVAGVKMEFYLDKVQSESVICKSLLS